MIAISLPTVKRCWRTMSFTSTLYLCPILELLIADIPDEIKPEINLGLQEALVNAAKHGNSLNPDKTIIIHYSATANEYSWVISDQGAGFSPCCNYSDTPDQQLAVENAENGRGLWILHQIFDQVHWNAQGNQLKLCKTVK